MGVPFLVGNVPWRRLGAVGRLDQALPALGKGSSGSKGMFAQRDREQASAGVGKTGEVIHMTVGWRGAFQVLPHLFHLCNPWHLTGAFHLEISNMNTVITPKQEAGKIEVQSRWRWELGLKQEQLRLSVLLKLHLL